MPSELIPTNPLQWGITGFFAIIVLAFVWALLKGHLVPSKILDDVRKDRDERLQGAQEVITRWKEAADTQKGVVDQLMPVLEDLRTDSKTIVKSAVLFAQQYESGGGQ